jgi:2-keto-4-pentenoate hydratase/2-oxohepta-3-ene-1,7-dioic acid hydratase in catechol pathway
VLRGDDVVDVAAAGDLPADPVAVLASGPETLRALSVAVAGGAPGVPLADVRLLAPVARPPKFFAIGLNYADHVAEARLETPEFPVVFTKLPTCVTGPHDDVQRPLVSDQLDYEGELGFVVGRRCRHVPRERAAEVIAGYVAVNDVSVRDWQTRSGPWASRSTRTARSGRGSSRPTRSATRTRSTSARGSTASCASTRTRAT